LPSIWLTVLLDRICVLRWIFNSSQLHQIIANLLAAGAFGAFASFLGGCAAHCLRIHGPRSYATPLLCLKWCDCDEWHRDRVYSVTLMHQQFGTWCRYYGSDDVSLPISPKNLSCADEQSSQPDVSFSMKTWRQKKLGKKEQDGHATLFQLTRSLPHASWQLDKGKTGTKMQGTRSRSQVKWGFGLS
jgi:hypothetical protein